MIMTRPGTLKIYPINKLVAVVAAMNAEGIAVEQALHGTGIAPHELTSSDARMSVSQLLTAYRNALALSGDPTFALRLGRSVQVTTYGLYGYALLSSPTQRALIELAAKYHRMMAAPADLSFREATEGQLGVWTVTPVVPESGEPVLYRFLVEVTLGALAALSDDILQRPQQIRQEVRLTYPRSPVLPDYESFFNCPVLFGQNQNELTINTAWLDSPTRYGNEFTFTTIQKMCADSMAKIVERTGLAGELQRILLESAGRFPTVQVICQRLGIEPRTFRRKLHAEGTSYGVVVNETRVDIAKGYLRDTVMTVEEIASRIGYSDASNFRRAFQRSTNLTPAAYRRSALR
jgi:AraC-like DNA-binding protein